MKFDSKGILYASLVGSKVNVPRFEEVQNELMKHVLPPIPFLPFTNTENVRKPNSFDEQPTWQADTPLSEEQQFFPFTFVGANGVKYLLPYEPMVTIGGKNNIVRRNVAKAKGMIGSIKERWSQGDYEITITGVLVGSVLTGSVEDCFPRADFEKLRDFMTASKDLKVYCEPLQLLGINKIVIEDFRFPFTKGENVQAYEIKAYSDFAYNLLLDIND